MPFKNKSDQSAYYKKWRMGAGKDKFYAGKKRYQDSIKKLITEIKRNSSCNTCNESHPATLSFHHRDPSLKLFNIGDIYMLRMGKASILSEVAKCDTLCHNCHAKLHWREEDVV